MRAPPESFNPQHRRTTFMAMSMTLQLGRMHARQRATEHGEILAET